MLCMQIGGWVRLGSHRSHCICAVEVWGFAVYTMEHNSPIKSSTLVGVELDSYVSSLSFCSMESAVDDSNHYDLMRAMRAHTKKSPDDRQILPKINFQDDCSHLPASWCHLEPSEQSINQYESDADEIAARKGSPATLKAETFAFT